MRHDPHKDQALHEALQAAHEEGRLLVVTDIGVLGHPGSPVHSPWDSLLPPLVLMTASLFVLLFTGLAIGIAAMTAAALALPAAMRHWVARRLHRRAVDALMHDARHWQALWNLGGIAMALAEAPAVACVAPRGNWRDFAERHLRAAEAGAPAGATVIEAEVLDG